MPQALTQSVPPIGFAASLIACVAAVAALALAPEPDPIPRRWQLSVEVGPMRVASVDIPNVGPRSFYYMPYKVTNTTDQDLLFTPAFELVGDDSRILRAGSGVPSVVTRDVLDRLDNPFMQDPVSVVGVLLQGEANAKESVAIWPVELARQSQLSVYAAGFSGETRAVEVPDGKGGVTKVLLRKTLMLRFQGPGEVRDMGSTPLEVTEKQWIMR
jgi:hypothetical protein